MLEFFNIKIKDYLSKVENELELHQINFVVYYCSQDLDSRMIYAFKDPIPNLEPTALQTLFCCPERRVCFVYRFFSSCHWTGCLVNFLNSLGAFVLGFRSICYCYIKFYWRCFRCLTWPYSLNSKHYFSSSLSYPYPMIHHYSFFQNWYFLYFIFHLRYSEAFLTMLPDFQYLDLGTLANLVSFYRTFVDILLSYSRRY